MLRLRSTEKHKRFWRNRKIDWEAQYLATWDHPHRQLIMQVLASFSWISLWEIGCGPGANLVRILKAGFQGRQLGGNDVNQEAVDLAKKTFTHGMFHCESAEDMMLSDGAVDVVLSDATLIYVGPGKIQSTIKEIVRVVRNNVVFCEFHSTSWIKRWLLRLRTGYNAYDYRKLLEEAGCYDIQIFKIPKEYWPDTEWADWGYIIMAKVPKKI